MVTIILRFLGLVACALAQQAGHQKSDAHPSLSWSTCTASNGCSPQQGSVAIDSNWDWTHAVGQSKNCYTGDEWDKSLCPDGPSCAKNCALDSGSVSDFKDTYGISTDGNALSLKFVTKGPYSRNVGSRTYLFDEGKGEYVTFMLKNKEFTFDVDVSTLPCGLNGALYFVRMDADGGSSKYSGNAAGAKFGTGYCDAQCPHDIKFINGEGNVEGWKPSPTDKNSGQGHYGTCCTEMDVWESNSISEALTPHVCTVDGQTRCEGTQCGDDASGQRYDGVCDKDGCDWNPYRLGDKTFYGPGANFTVDSSKKITVVTQFVTADGTDSGDLSEIRRLYVQNDKVINMTAVEIPGHGTFSSISDDFCNAQKAWTNDTNAFEKRGGLKKLGDDMGKGMVLVMSLWDDYAVHMLWLDSTYPPNKDPSAPGVARGPCPTSSGNPTDVEEKYPDATVIYSNIKFGDIGSTFNGGGPSPPSGCPGGSLSACIALCPSNPPAAYKDCVQECIKRCPSS